LLKYMGKSIYVKTVATGTWGWRYISK
jgi:hypothetical protein